MAIETEEGRRVEERMGNLAPQYSPVHSNELRAINRQPLRQLELELPFLLPARRSGLGLRQQATAAQRLLIRGVAAPVPGSPALGF